MFRFRRFPELCGVVILRRKTAFPGILTLDVFRIRLKVNAGTMTYVHIYKTPINWAHHFNRHFNLCLLVYITSHHCVTLLRSDQNLSYFKGGFLR